MTLRASIGAAPASADSTAPIARLQGIKDRWDPTNVFRHNQNIPPSRETGRQPVTPTPVTAG